jgi:hypothetical protein
MKSLMLSIGSPKNLVAALGLGLHQPALDRADAGRADVAVFGGELAGVVAHVLQHGAQVLQVEQQHAVVVGDLEDEVQHAGLGVVQVEHAAQAAAGPCRRWWRAPDGLVRRTHPTRMVGQACEVGISSPRSFSVAASLSPTLPGWLIPVKSPLTSAMKTGTPIREKLSARLCSVTVLPVPVAPVMRPCRFARLGSSSQLVWRFWQ